MAMTAQMHRPKSAKAVSRNGSYWVTFYDADDNEMTFFVDDPLVSTMLAEAFEDAQEKLLTYTREQLIAEGGVMTLLPDAECARAIDHILKAKRLVEKGDISSLSYACDELISLIHLAEVMVGEVNKAYQDECHRLDRYVEGHAA